MHWWEQARVAGRATHAWWRWDQRQWGAHENLQEPIQVPAVCYDAARCCVTHRLLLKRLDEHAIVQRLHLRQRQAMQGLF